jgi:thioredoxin reductase (NADPH)
MKKYDLIVVGAGPSGLACAIEAQKGGLTCLTLDKGSVADAIRRFPVNMTFFSTPELLEIGDIPFLAAGFRPTRIECVRYYQMVANHYGLAIQRGADVTALRRLEDGFEVVTTNGSFAAANVVVATGYFDDPNSFDVPGAELPKVHRYYSEPYAYSGLNVAIVGGKNSAVEMALDLFRNGAKVTLIHRGPTLSSGVKYWILPDIENRIKAGEITALFETQVREIRPPSVVCTGAHEVEIPNDVVFVMIGYLPSTALLKGVGVEIDHGSKAPVHNMKTMETNVPHIYVAGSIAAGRFNNRIFIENGRTHGKLIIDSISKVH